MLGNNFFFVFFLFVGLFVCFLPFCGNYIKFVLVFRSSVFCASFFCFALLCFFLFLCFFLLWLVSFKSLYCISDPNLLLHQTA